MTHGPHYQASFLTLFADVGISGLSVSLPGCGLIK